MSTMLALVWGIIAFLGFLLGMIPCLGWFNWINIPFATVGVVIGIVALSQAGAQNRPVGPAVVGLSLSVAAVVIGVIRLVLGGGLV
jgi:hypothetical protein